MKVSLAWLREWVAITQSATEIADRLTTLGLEVDSVQDLAESIENVVVGKVVSVSPHPDADRLRVCEVDDGGGVQQVVCGAPNVAEGVVVPFARVGATLPGGGRIKAARLRGVQSHGMLCSAAELGLAESSEGLLLLDAAASVGMDIVAHLGLRDSVLDVDLTPNRGDCFSVLGIARELAAQQQGSISGPTLLPVPHVIEDSWPVILDDPMACPRFLGRVIRGVDNDRASPLWLAERLRRAGLRAINPIVDVTNYVMLELGQPLHAYDLSLLQGDIRVRQSVSGEQLSLLTGREITLAADTLLIADDRGPIGLAGIMGGASTATSTATTDVFFEAAWFAPSAVSGRARRYGLHTDASLRFERGVDPEGARRAIERASALLLEIAGGQPGPVTETLDAEHLPRKPSITLRSDRVARVLGCEVAPAQVDIMLNALGMTVTNAAHGWQVIPPSHRFDLEIEEDLIEELGRMIGYDAIPMRPALVSARLGHASERRIDEESLADCLVERGYSEIISYSFIDADLNAAVAPKTQAVALSNPISADMSVMRSSLWPGLLATARQNLARQASRLRLFEIGPRFISETEEIQVLAGLATGPRLPEQWAASTEDTDFYDVKADVEALLALVGGAAQFSFRASSHPALRPGQQAAIYRGDVAVGLIGSLHPRLQRDLDARAPIILFELDTAAAFSSQATKFRAFSRQPAVRRDLALIVPRQTPAADIMQTVRQSAGSQLREVFIFDDYRGKGIDASSKSVAIGLILQEASRTLTDKEVDAVIETVTLTLQRELGAAIRT